MEQISQAVQMPTAVQVQQQAQQKQKPLDKFSNSGVATAIWPNQIMVNNQSKIIFKATLQKRFKDKDGNWKNSNSYSKNEIKHAIYCLEKAYDKIIELENGLKNSAAPAGVVNTADNVSVAGNGVTAAGYA